MVCNPKPRASATTASTTWWLAGLRRQVANELDVDLQEVERELLQVGEAPIAGPEVVERELAAESVEAFGEGERRSLVPDERRFRDLEDQQVRIHAALLDAPLDMAQDPLITD